MLLIRDVLDAQVFDRLQNPVGKVDGIIIDISDPARMRVQSLQMGAPVLLRRLKPVFARPLGWFARRWHAKTSTVPWENVRSVSLNVEITLEKDDLPSLSWERWLDAHLIGKIPGARRKR